MSDIETKRLVWETAILVINEARVGTDTETGPRFEQRSRLPEPVFAACVYEHYCKSVPSGRRMQTRHASAIPATVLLSILCTISMSIRSGTDRNLPPCYCHTGDIVIRVHYKITVSSQLENHTYAPLQCPVHSTHS